MSSTRADYEHLNSGKWRCGSSPRMCVMVMMCKSTPLNC